MAVSANVAGVFCDSNADVFAPAVPLEFPHKSCDKSFRGSRKSPAISVLQKSVPDSNPRCKIRRFSAKPPLKSVTFAHAFGVFSQPHRRFYFDTPYTQIASNSAPTLVLSYLLLVQAPPLSLYCSFRLALIVLLCFSLLWRDVFFS